MIPPWAHEKQLSQAMTIRQRAGYLQQLWSDEYHAANELSRSFGYFFSAQPPPRSFYTKFTRLTRMVPSAIGDYGTTFERGEMGI